MTSPAPIGPDDISALPGAELKGMARVRHAMADAHAASAAWRASVLAVPELAARLISELGYRNARDWNGYVPPAFDSSGNRNHSPRRDLLIELVVAAESAASDIPDNPDTRGTP